MTHLGDQELRDALTRAGERLTVPPLPLDSVIASGTRRRRRATAVRAAGAVVAVSAVALAVAVPLTRGSTPTPASSGGHSPVIATSSPSNRGPGHRPPACRAGDLRLAPGLPVSPATGEVAASYAVVNTANTSCNLAGVPHVEFFSAQGIKLPLRQTRKPTMYVPARHPERVVVEPGGRPAGLIVAKYRCDSGARIRAATVRISVGAGTVTGRAGNEQIAYCNGGRSDPGQVFAASAFTTTR